MIVETNARHSRAHSREVMAPAERILANVQRTWVLLGLTVLLVHCQSRRADPSGPPAPSSAAVGAPVSHPLPTRPAASAGVGKPAGSYELPAALARWGLPDFRRWFSLSGPGDAFISDNVVSNETGLGEPAAKLSSLQGGVYVGVGPEQNFSLIAWSRPDLGLLLDIRRDNALLHLLYKALFELCTTRLEFAGWLLGRPPEAAPPLPPEASAARLVEAIERISPDRAWFERHHRLAVERIQGYGLDLSRGDWDRIRRLHQLFFERQLDLHFELRETNGRRYPPLRELWTLRGPAGHGTFLDTAEAFERVRTMQRQHRIVPLVGDVSTPKPLGLVADELARNGWVLRVFYISNVEQYLLGSPAFRGWRDNLEKLPHDGSTLVLRTYLDQGRAHPRQQPGHRSTQLLHRLTPFLSKTERQGYPSYYALATDGSLEFDGSAKAAPLGREN